MHQGSTTTGIPTIQSKARDAEFGCRLAGRCPLERRVVFLVLGHMAGVAILLLGGLRGPVGCEGAAHIDVDTDPSLGSLQG
jgi:hypothetical protein